ncbi:MAG: tetratricopeptide repeat protein [Microscillaceae bacterium]|nr:tetratricopeptide repeat protein [Microscillaceae bacterium]
MATELAQPLSQQLSTLEALAFNYEQIQDFPHATQQYQKILSVYAAQKNYTAQTNVLATLSRWSVAQQDSSKAIGYQEEILKISQITSNLALAMNTHNNLGALYNQRGDAQKSMMHLQTALNIYQSIGALLPDPNQKAQLLLNTGVTYTYLRDYKSATEQYQAAFKIFERNNDAQGTANTYNYLAANYYVSGKNDLATSNALKAVSLALALNDEAILLVSYQILADAYQQSRDYRLSQQYLKSFQELREKMAEKERLTRQRLLEEQIEIEKKENELRTAQAEKERQSAQLRQSELERARQEQDLKIKENELALLRRNQDLQAADLRNQQLERQRVQQLLEITRQKSLAEKERLLATQQKQEAERQKLLAEKAKIEREKEQKAREASEKQQKHSKTATGPGKIYPAVWPGFDDIGHTGFTVGGHWPYQRPPQCPQTGPAKPTNPRTK